MKHSLSTERPSKSVPRDTLETAYPKAVVGLVMASLLLSQLALGVAGAAAIGWGRTSLESSLSPLAPAFGAVELTENLL